MAELSNRLGEGPAVVTSCCDELQPQIDALDVRADVLEASSTDHETRIDVLEAGGGGGSADLEYTSVEGYLAPSSAATPWSASAVVTAGLYRSNGGNLYHCITPGTTAGSGGPTTTSKDITDGTAHWRYVGAGNTRVAGTTDDYSAVVLAEAAAVAAGHKRVFDRPGGYSTWQAVKSTSNGVKFFGVLGNIKFPSADTSLITSTGYETAERKRSAFYVYDKDDVVFEGLIATGNSSETDITVNLGVLVCTWQAKRLRVTRCQQWYGGGLVSQYYHVDDSDARIDYCYSYGSRLNTRIGRYGVVEKCTFELPTDAGYDRVGSNGSSHGIYIYGGEDSATSSDGRMTLVDGCTFLNMRKQAVKVSGSAFPMGVVRVVNCLFRGGTEYAVEFGADDHQQHSACIIANNMFLDGGPAIGVYGSRSVSIAGNVIYYSTAPASSHNQIIHVKRYEATSTSKSVEDCIVQDNIISADPVIGAGSVALYGIFIERGGTSSKLLGQVTAISQSGSGSAITSTITLASTTGFILGERIFASTTRSGRSSNRTGYAVVTNINSGTGVVTALGSLTGVAINDYILLAVNHQSQVVVRGNTLSYCSSYGVATISCNAPLIEHNTFNGLNYAGYLTGDRMPCIGPNTHINQQQSTAAWKMDSACSWPDIDMEGQRYIGRVGVQRGKVKLGNGSNVTTDYPLRARGGLAIASNSVYEVVFAYGGGYVDGDTINLNGTNTFTYKGTAPGAGEFSTIAELITLINAVAGYTAADYGTTWSVASGHIKVTRASSFYMGSECAMPTAGVFLFNDTTQTDRCYARGGAANQIIIWSQRASRLAVPVLAAKTDSARLIGYPTIETSADSSSGDADDDGACLVLEFDTLAAGTEQIRWRI